MYSFSHLHLYSSFYLHVRLGCNYMSMVSNQSMHRYINPNHVWKVLRGIPIMLDSTLIVSRILLRPWMRWMWIWMRCGHAHENPGANHVNRYSFDWPCYCVIVVSHFTDIIIWLCKFVFRICSFFNPPMEPHDISSTLTLPDIQQFLFIVQSIVEGWLFHLG